MEPSRIYNTIEKTDETERFDFNGVQQLFFTEIGRVSEAEGQQYTKAQLETYRSALKRCIQLQEQVREQLNLPDDKLDLVVEQWHGEAGLHIAFIVTKLEDTIKCIDANEPIEMGYRARIYDEALLIGVNGTEDLCDGSEWLQEAEERIVRGLIDSTVPKWQLAVAADWETVSYGKEDDDVSYTPGEIAKSKEGQSIEESFFISIGEPHKMRKIARIALPIQWAKATDVHSTQRRYEDATHELKRALEYVADAWKQRDEQVENYYLTLADNIEDLVDLGYTMHLSHQEELSAID